MVGFEDAGELECNEVLLELPEPGIWGLLKDEDLDREADPGIGGADPTGLPGTCSEGAGGAAEGGGGGGALGAEGAEDCGGVGIGLPGTCRK